MYPHMLGTQGYGKKTASALFLSTGLICGQRVNLESLWHCLLLALRSHCGFFAGSTVEPTFAVCHYWLARPESKILNYFKTKKDTAKLYRTEARDLLSAESVTLEISGCRSQSSLCGLDLGLFWRWRTVL